MPKCEGCGKEVPRLQTVRDVEEKIYYVCPVCKAKMERNVEETKYWKEKRYRET